MTGSRIRQLASWLGAFYYLEAGLLLVMAPWSHFWLRRVVATAPSGLRDLLASPYLRGFVTGVGLLHLLAAIWEIQGLRRAHATSPSPISADAPESGEVPGPALDERPAAASAPAINERPAAASAPAGSRGASTSI